MRVQKCKVVYANITVLICQIPKTAIKTSNFKKKTANTRQTLPKSKKI